RCLSSLREDGSYLEPNELRRDFAVALIASFRPAVLDRDGTTLDPAEFVQSLHKSSNPLAHGPSGTHAQEADGPHLALLRVRVDRPCGGRAAEKCDELATSQLIELHSVPSQGPDCRISNCRGSVRRCRSGTQQRKAEYSSEPRPRSPSLRRVHWSKEASRL